MLHDAELGEAVKAAAFGAFMNQGQICMSTERIIVVDAVADEFIAQFSAKAKTLVAGDPREGKTPLGAVVDLNAAQHVRDLVYDAVSQGGRLAAGGDGEGVLMPATVVDYVTPAMRLYREESFGPVVAVIRVKDEEAAIAAANDSEYGLSASVFSRDIARALSVAQADSIGNLPHQRPDGSRRGADALRRGEGQRLWALRRPGRRGGIHRTALDHDRDPGRAFPHLRCS